MRGLVAGVVSVIGHTSVLLLDFLGSRIQLYVLLSPYLCFYLFLYLDLYVLGDDLSIC